MLWGDCVRYLSKSRRMWHVAEVSARFLFGFTLSLSSLPQIAQSKQLNFKYQDTIYMVEKLKRLK